MPRVISNYDRHLGAKLRHIREGQGMMPLHLARAIGVSHGTLESYELGSARMPPDRIKRAADALKVDVETFLTVIPDDQLQNEFVDACKGINDDQVMAVLHQAVTEVLRAEARDEAVATPGQGQNGRRGSLT